MKDWLRSLLSSDSPPAKPKPRRPAAVPARRDAASAAKTAPAIKGAAKSAPTVQDWSKVLEGRTTATVVRDMLRMKLKDPDYAKRFAQALRAMMREEEEK